MAQPASQRSLSHGSCPGSGSAHVCCVTRMGDKGVGRVEQSAVLLGRVCLQASGGLTWLLPVFTYIARPQPSPWRVRVAGRPVARWPICSRPMARCVPALRGARTAPERTARRCGPRRDSDSSAASAAYRGLRLAAAGGLPHDQQRSVLQSCRGTRPRSPTPRRAGQSALRQLSRPHRVPTARPRRRRALRRVGRAHPRRTQAPPAGPGTPPLIDNHLPHHACGRVTVRRVGCVRRCSGWGLRRCGRRG